MSAEIYSGTVSEFVSSKRYRRKREVTENVKCVRVVDVQDRGGQRVAESQLIVLCAWLRELGPEVGDRLQFQGDGLHTKGRYKHYRGFMKLPPR